MKPIKYFINEAVKPENGEDWEVYVNNKLFYIGSTDRALNGTDIKTMEYALILAFQPEGNLAGIKTPFKY